MNQKFSILKRLFRGFSALIMLVLAISCSNDTFKIPELKTTEISSLTATTVSSGGSIISDGGDPIVFRGICWDTNINPTIANNKTLDGSGNGIFESVAVGLTPGETYYIRAYATNSVGTGYGNVIAITSLGEETLRDYLQAYPGIKGESVSMILNGNEIICNKINDMFFFQGDIIISPEQKGAALDDDKLRWPENKVYYTVDSSFPDQERIKDSFKEFEKTNIIFKERTNETNYVDFKYIKDAGCYSSLGMRGGKQEIVIDNWGTPAIIAHEIGHTLGLLHEQSKSTRDQYINIIIENVVEGKEHNFEKYSSSINTAGFDFNSLMLYSSYAFSKQYGVKPTITKKDGSVFTPQQEHFTEDDIKIIDQLYPGLPEITTSAITSILQATATGGGNISSDGGSTVTARGICWGTSQNPTIANNKTTNGAGTGSFTGNLTGLAANTTYYVRAYATNSKGTAYGNEVSFTTGQVITLPVLMTSAITNITQISATGGGNITSDGGSTVTARGICWGTSQNPTITNNKTNNGFGIGSFTSNLTGLIANTTYYIRAYATNSVGTVYGNEVSFTTLKNKENETVTDIDGNVYHTVTIGTQVWMVENLKTTKYNDGTNVPNVTFNTAWNNLATPGYCWYNNNINNKKIYGALYNWYATSTGKLAPKGWHVPSDEEWTTLVNYLGGEMVAGGKLKEVGTQHWKNPNTNATNESGFTGIASGLRDYVGTFNSEDNTYSAWWSLSSSTSVLAWYRVLSFDRGSIVRSDGAGKSAGFSVRCIKD